MYHVSSTNTRRAGEYSRGGVHGMRSLGLEDMIAGRVVDELEVDAHVDNEIEHHSRSLCRDPRSRAAARLQPVSRG